MPLVGITQPDLYDTRDKCAVKKWPRFADQMISALSSMFRQAVKRGKMPFNPCLGMDKAHKADPNANREWESDEWQFARENAPVEIKICLFLARYAGLRGQTIVQVNRKQFKPHPLTGQAVRYKARKNDKFVNLPALPELQAFMGELKVKRTDGLIAVRDDGTVWPSEKEMQTRVSHWLRDQERAGHIGPGTTLHGLRVSYAAWWRRNGANTREVADLIGDEFGTHGCSLYPPRRGRAEYHPGVQQNQGWSRQGVNGFCSRIGKRKGPIGKHLPPWPGKASQIKARTWRNW